jgi:hypothetical protein
MLKKLLIISTFLPSIALAGTNNIEFLNFSSQAQFKNFSTDLTGALGYKTLTPAEPLGITGFSIGAAYTQSNLNYKLMNKVSSHPSGNISGVSLHALKGLPLGIDLGVDYMTVPNSNITTLGGTLSYALIEGGTAYPAIGLKASYNQTQGIKALDASSYGAELGISKGFANFTPYAALGMVNGEITPHNQYSTGVQLRKTTSSLVKYAVGVNINLFLMDVLVGYNQIGDVSNYTAKIGYRF